MNKINRKTFIKGGLIGGVLSIYTGSAQAASPTPEEIEGPFYPIVAQKDKDFDLTQIKGKKGQAKGQIVIIEGRVLDSRGQAIEDATVDIWQANAAGRYNHPHDPNPAPLDPNFQGWAIVQSGTSGAFRFKTVLPGAYPASSDWTRPPHIHFKVSKKGYIEVTTQMYFPEQKLNQKDRLLQRKSKAEQLLMIASKAKNGNYKYNIILEKI